MKKRRVLFILALLSSLVGVYFYWFQTSIGLETDKFYEVKILSLDKQIAAVCKDYQEKLSQPDLLKLEKTLQEQTTALKKAAGLIGVLQVVILSFWNHRKMLISFLHTWSNVFNPAKYLGALSSKIFGIWKQIPWTAKELENSWHIASS